MAEKADVLEYRMRMFKGVGERFLNGFPSFIDNVRCANIIPVKNGSNAFLSPRDERLRVFPMFLMKVFDADAELECPFERVDFSGRLQSDHLRDALRVLKVRELDERELWHVIDHLGSLSEWFVVGRSELLLRGRILRSILVDSACSRLAELLECQPLSAISYRDLPCEPWKISREDVVDIKDGNIEDKENILLLAVKDGRISEDCALEFGLTTGLASDVDDMFDFPVEPLKNPQGLKKHIQEAWNNPIQIVCKQVMRAVDFCVPLRGREFELSSREARLSALRRYSPYGRTDVCFCQMCRRVNRRVFVEANCIERKPRYYFPELRLTLCLECSKKFELLRNNRDSTRISLGS